MAATVLLKRTEHGVVSFTDPKIIPWLGLGVIFMKMHCWNVPNCVGRFNFLSVNKHCTLCANQFICVDLVAAKTSILSL